MAKKRQPKQRTASGKSSPASKTTRKKKSSRAARSSPAAETAAAETGPFRAEGDSFPIVGIGASAGGLEALRSLLEAMPDEPGVAIVVVQHLDPTKKSLAPELLAKYTKMEVAQVHDDPHVKPNRVYVIPPDKYLSISGGELHLSEPDRPRGARMAIDFFLRSLAQDQHQCAVGLILSGSGTNGTLGIKAIKAAGGLVIGQDPTTAQFDSMPRSAIDTGVVDHVLPPAEMPAVLVRYANHSYVRDKAAATPADEEADSPPPGGEDLEPIIAFLRANTKHDFRNYKDKTIVRRTRRRMCLHHVDGYEVYLKYLRDHPHEIEALVKDLLITGTDFFREPDAWDELRERAIRPMVEKKDDDQPIRVWVPGCATGEEPYSVAMLILEELKRAEKNCPLHVFASDIDKDAIQYAREGRYPKSIQADVSPERLQRFFAATDGDDYYHVNKLLRESVVFAEQDLIGDPPFSKLDLVCCRNLLIYLKADVQEKIIALFHFALRAGGVLFLGSAETIGRQTDLFDTLHKRWRIFRRIGPTRHDRVEIPISDVRHRREIEVQPAPPVRRETRLSHLAQQRLLDMLAPSAVLVDRNWRIQYICGDVDPYLSLKPGVPTVDLLDNARRGLRSKLRAAVQRALSEERPVSLQARVQRDGTYHAVAITVRVIHDREQEEELALVMFSEPTALGAGIPTPPKGTTEGLSATASRRSAEGAGSGDPRSAQRDARTARREPRPPETDDLDDHAVIRQLEEELAATKDDLQASVEQLETGNEEYKAANEEVMSINEELQSTNEELETSKEELQSLNEELSTVNSQLGTKVGELETKNADLQNLLTATDVATICLDTDLAIRWFTPAIKDVIRLRDADIGRPLADFTHDFTDGGLAKAAEQVLKKLTPIEDEATCKDDRVFLRRITPYRTDDHRIGGVVITFFDITERKKVENAMAAAKEMAEKIIDTVRESMLVLDVDLQVVSANESFYRTFHVAPEQTEGRLIYQLGNNQWDIPELRKLLEDVLPENNVFNDFEVDHDFETIGRKVMLLNGRKIDHIQRILLAIRDITEFKTANEFIRLTVEASPVAAVMTDVSGEIVLVNSQTEQLFGYDRSELLGQAVEKLIPKRFRDRHVRDRTAYVSDPEPRPMDAGRDLFGLRKDGSEFAVEVALSPLETPQGPHVLAAIADISGRKAAEQALRESEQRVRLATEGAHIGTWEWDLETDQGTWDERESGLIGLEPAPMPVTASEFFDRVHPEDTGGLRAAIERALKEDKPYEHEFRVIHPDGQIRWLAGKGEVFRDAQGKPKSMRGVNFDITPRKSLEQKLRKLRDSLEEQVEQRTAMLKLLQDITRGANEARTVEESMLVALERISQYNGWQVGHVWRLADDGSGDLVSSRVWHIAEKAELAVGRLEEFRRICEQTRFAPGDMVVGAVAKDDKPRWIDDIVKSSDWRRGNADGKRTGNGVGFHFGD